MSEQFELSDVEQLTAGTVGPPGQRVFYLQARQGGLLVSLKLEKQQVGALATYLARLLADLPEVEAGEAADLEEPVEPAWTVGTIGISYDEDADRILILAEELTVQEEDEDTLDDLDRGVARLRITRPQAATLALRGAELVAAGRPTCQLCGYPLDPEGHLCPRSNGQRPPTP